MKTHPTQPRQHLSNLLAGMALALLLAGCERQPHATALSHPARLQRTIDPLAFVLAPHPGEGRLDAAIREGQAQVRSSTHADLALERLGWLFVSKARESFDPGFYRMAEHCALSLETRAPASPAALLLRGHALHSQHRFSEAEPLARTLVQQRGLAFDHRLLGDILVDLGRLDEATRSYQTMLDLKPDPEGFARAGLVRWLKGDLPGAIEVMQMAARGATPQDHEAAAWMHTQLARYLWQAGAATEAERALDGAIDFQSRYAPALLLRGRMRLAAGRISDAVQTLRQAVEANPLPEYQWALSEALHAGRRDSEARAVEDQLLARGAFSDPRTFSIYLSTRRERVDSAVRLARTELQERGDIFSHDALAWALVAAGQLDEAQAQMNLALAEHTQDARLYYHAAVIAATSGQADKAQEWMEKVAPLRHLLLPSELARLQAAAALLASAPPPFPTVASKPTVAEN